MAVVLRCLAVVEVQMVRGGGGGGEVGIHVGRAGDTATGGGGNLSGLCSCLVGPRWKY